MRALILLLLAGCPKPSTTSQPQPDPTTAGPSTPAGFTRVLPPGNFKFLRPLTSAALPDGSFSISGAAVRVVQYQWTLRVPETGDPVQNTFDPGRIEWVHDNGTAGLDAVGVLGGVPEDKAWYGEIDAFSNLGTRQTYLSDGSGQLDALVRVDEGLVVAGEMLAADGKVHGWMVRADNSGRDIWKTQLGDAAAQGIDWMAHDRGTLVAAGWRLGPTEDPWIATVDADGTLITEYHWDEPGWTRLTSGRLIGDADVMVAGISAPTSEGALDGSGSLWIGRIGQDGTPRWDRSEREDLSMVTRATPWGRGIAIAALRGPYGSPRTVMVASVSDDGKTRWSEPDLPAGITWAEVHSVNEKLILIAAIVDDDGLAYRKIVLEGGAAP